MKERVASQLEYIRHWTVIEGDYTAAPDVAATWFIDPPYQRTGDKIYVHKARDIDYRALAAWCRQRRGQVMVCENDGATWLPFKRLYATSTAMNGAANVEVLWTNAEPLKSGVGTERTSHFRPVKR